MNTYLLIHGAWHGKWCWDKIVLLLQKVGHTVIAPDLPGHGEDQTPFKHIHLNTYVKFIEDIIQAISGKVILVGHSMAGMCITQVANNYPQKIAKLVYIAGYFPENGESLIDINKKFIAPSRLFNIQIDDKDKSISIQDNLKEIFYNCCSNADVATYAKLIQAEPYYPFIEKVTLDQKRFAHIEKVYVACLLDNALLPEAQNAMAVRANCNIVSLKIDHSPFFSTPEALVKLLSNV